MEGLTQVEYHSDKLEDLSISELVSILRLAFRTADFDRVEEALITKEVNLKKEVEDKNEECKSIQEKFEFLRLDKLNLEARLEQFEMDHKELANWKATSEKLKEKENQIEVLKIMAYNLNNAREEALEKERKAVERYEKLSEEVKFLKCAKGEVEQKLEHWRMKCGELTHRIARLEHHTRPKTEGPIAVASHKPDFEPCAAGSTKLVSKESSDRTENRKGSATFAAGGIVEVVDSDDDHDKVYHLSGAHELQKRKRDVHLDNSEECDAKRAAEDHFHLPYQSVEDSKEVITSSRIDTVRFRQCKERVGVSRNSQFKSATRGKDYSSEDCCISLEFDDSIKNKCDTSHFKGKDRANGSSEIWEFESDMLAAFEEKYELCMEAVCVLYRQSNSMARPPCPYITSNNRGFNQSDELRGTTLALFLVNGDPEGKLKRSAIELKNFDISGLSDCKRIAIAHSAQLFEIYKTKEDRFFSK